jgi:hypothetical protein
MTRIEQKCVQRRLAVFLGSTPVFLGYSVITVGHLCRCDPSDGADYRVDELLGLGFGIGGVHGICTSRRLPSGAQYMQNRFDPLSGTLVLSSPYI